MKDLDITIKRGIDKKYDDELGLTGRDVHQVVLRLAQALEDRDKKIKQLEQEIEDFNECHCGKCDYCVMFNGGETDEPYG